MNIDFIKWVFEKAGAPFKVTVFPNITMIDLPIYEHSKDINDFDKVCPDWLKSLLWQMAIEGVNSTAVIISNDLIIEQGYSYILVKECNPSNRKLFSGFIGCESYSEFKTYTEAKESALKYIYEQETA